MTRRPNLFVIGAMKAGTSTLHSLLAQHPDIYMSRVKEPGYFVASDGVRPARQFATAYAGNRQAYLRLFMPAGAAKYAGESSPDYTRIPAIGGVPERIRQFSGDAALIYIMRDPIARSISHYWWNVQHYDERREMYEAICSDRQYQDVSNYAMQLRPYLDQFGRQRIHLMTLERLVSDPRGSLRDLFSWLGVDPSFASADRKPHENPTAEVLEVPVGSRLLHRLRFSRLWNVVGGVAPKGLRAFARRKAYKYVNRVNVPTHGVVEYLRAIQREQVNELCNLVGCEFPEWRTLHGGADGRVGIDKPRDGCEPASFVCADPI